jgi:hypothetical protein
VLVHEDVVVSLLHRDTQEVVEWSQVLHGEFLLEDCSGTLQKLRVQGNEDDVGVEEQVYNVSVAVVDEQ